MRYLCQRQNEGVSCAKPAACALGVAFYPHKSLMEFYKTTKPLTRAVMTVFVCEEHAVEAEATGPWALIKRDYAENLAHLVSRRAGTVIDIEATKVLRVALDDTDLKSLLRKDRHKQELHRG